MDKAIETLLRFLARLLVGPCPFRHVRSMRSLKRHLCAHIFILVRSLCLHEFDWCAPIVASECMAWLHSIGLNQTASAREPKMALLQPLKGLCN